MKRYYVDANIFLRFLLNDDATQADLAERYFEQAKREEIELTIIPLTIIEVVYVLTKVYKETRSQVTKNIKTILSMSYLKVKQRKELLQAVELYERHNVDFVDTFLYACAKNDTAEVLSFDKDFKKLS